MAYKSNKKIKFVIITYQRTGSTFLSLTLNGLEGVICHSELFNNGKQAFINSIFDTGLLPKITFLDKILGTDSAEKLFKFKSKQPIKFLEHIYEQDAHAIGFKIFPGQNDSVLDSILQNKGIKKIVLERKNLLNGYVSKQIAKKTGVWSKYMGEGTQLEKVKINVDSFIRYVNLIESSIEKVRDTLQSSNQEFLELYYEEMIYAFPLKKIANFLELIEYDSIPKVDQIKQNPYSLPEMIANFDDVQAELSNTNYEKYLQEI